MGEALAKPIRGVKAYNQITSLGEAAPNQPMRPGGLESTSSRLGYSYNQSITPRIGFAGGSPMRGANSWGCLSEAIAGVGLRQPHELPSQRWAFM